MTSLMDRYLNDIGRRLPARQRADILSELRSSLQDALDDQVKGQPTEDDVADLLREFGRPEEVVARYRPSSQYLIGPELYPSFKMALTFTLAAVALGLSVAFVMGLVFGQDPGDDLGRRLLGMLEAYIQVGVSVFGAIVIAFAIMQRLEFKPSDEKETAEWDPRTLPDAAERDLVKRGETATGLAFQILFLVLVNIFHSRVGFILSPGRELVTTTIVTDHLLWLNLLILLGIGLNLWLLVRGRWRWYTRVLKFAFDLGWLAVLFSMARAVNDSQDTLLAAGLVDPLPDLLGRLAYFVVAIVAVAILVDAGKVLYNCLRPDVSKMVLAKES
jgi:hypothetical protein